MTRPAKSGADERASAALQPKRSPRPALALSLQFADARHRGVLTRERVRRWLQAALERPAAITVRVVDADEGLALNRAWRQQEHATNVLTFAYAAEPEVEADLVLCAPVVEREAAEQGVALEAHYAHLLVHGALHARGFDHLNDADAARMEARETEILARLGVADPYRRS
jgi:probable rRNA maturation factor